MWTLSKWSLTSGESVFWSMVADIKFGLCWASGCVQLADRVSCSAVVDLGVELDDFGSWKIHKIEVESPDRNTPNNEFRVGRDSVTAMCKVN